MKTMSCDICDSQLQGETFDDWFKVCHQHYTNGVGVKCRSKTSRLCGNVAFYSGTLLRPHLFAGKPKEEGLKWMEDAKRRFEGIAEMKRL